MSNTIDIEMDDLSRKRTLAEPPLDGSISVWAWTSATVSVTMIRFLRADPNVALTTALLYSPHVYFRSLVSCFS